MFLLLAATMSITAAPPKISAAGTTLQDNHISRVVPGIGGLAVVGARLSLRGGQDAKGVPVGSAPLGIGGKSSDKLYPVLLRGLGSLQEQVSVFCDVCVRAFVRSWKESSLLKPHAFWEEAPPSDPASLGNPDCPSERMAPLMAWMPVTFDGCPCACTNQEIKELFDDCGKLVAVKVVGGGSGAGDSGAMGEKNAGTEVGRAKGEDLDVKGGGDKVKVIVYFGGREGARKANKINGSDYEGRRVRRYRRRTHAHTHIDASALELAWEEEDAGVLNDAQSVVPWPLTTATRPLS